MAQLSPTFSVIGFDVRYPSDSPTRGPWSVDDELCRPALDSERLAAWLSNPGLQTLWASLPNLQSAVKGESIKAGGQLIAVTWSEELARETDCYPAALRGPVDGVFWWHPREQHDVTPQELGGDWRFLGYDVADGWLLSGIWRCGFEDGLDVDRLDRDYYALLNCHGLFTEVSLAVAFSRAINPLAPEHAPFTPFGVWIHEASVP